METLRILVVDDEPGMRLGMTRCIEGLTVEVPEVRQVVGFTVETAEDGQGALAALASFRPDLLLLDYKLPDLSGLEVLKHIHEHQLDVLTIMVTAYATLETAIVATRQGAFDFLAKPYNPGELRGVVQKAARHLVLGRQARRLEEEKRKVRFQFISVLAHELKSPLAAVEGYLYLLQDPTLLAGRPEAAQQVVERSLVRLEGMRKLITDLLDMTRLESGQKARNLMSMDLAAVVTDLVRNQEPVAAPRGIALAVEAPAPVAVTADAGEVEILVNNLVSNAIKYNRDGGTVTVQVRTGPAGEALLSVTDTGIGMAPEEQARLFGEFVRIKNARTANILGSGLGLSIVRKIVDLYHGRVEVRSTPDVGSTFTVTLPLPDEGRA